MASQNITSSTKPFAVVTGASSGIGFELARQFARNGYDLLVAADDAELTAKAAELESDGAAVQTLIVDLATESGVETLAARITSSGRPVDAIALNAGIGVGGDFRETDLQAELKMIDLNCRSTVHLAKRVVPALAARGEGKMLFTASIASIMPAPFEAVYGATKAFVYSFAEALRNELKDTGVTVTALMPGPTETNFFHNAAMDDTHVGSSQKDDPAQVAEQGFAALMAGKDRVIAGSFATRAQAAVLEKLPDPVSAEVHRKMAEPESAHA